MIGCQKGRSMVEMVLVIGIIGALGISMMKIISGVYSRYKLNTVVWEIRQLQKNISAFYSAKGNYDGLDDYSDGSKMKDVATLVKEKVVPYDMVAGDGIKNSFSGGVVFYAVGASPSYAYEIKFSGLPKNACAELAMVNWSNNDTSDLFSLKINEADAVKWSIGSPASGKDYLPMDLVKSYKYCNSEVNEIVWNFQ